MQWLRPSLYPDIVKSLEEESQGPRIRRKDDPLLDWLSTLDFPTQQVDVIARRQAGTGQDLLGSRDFASWMDGRCKTLLCHGIPGAGKTMLAAIIIELLTMEENRSNTAVACVFCNHRSQANQGVTLLLAALLRQLVEGRSFLLHIVIRLHNECQKGKIRPSREQLFEALLQVCSTLACTYIVVDALDECSDQYGARSQFIERLQRLQEEANVRLLFTSRPMPEVTHKVNADVALEVRTSEKDVRKFVSGQLHRLSSDVQRNTGLLQRIVDGIVASAEGM